MPQTPPREGSLDGSVNRCLIHLKARLTAEPILRASDFQTPFVLSTDAFERDLGAQLMQEGVVQWPHPVALLSR